ncbi:hypothetical protein EI94DRAFT_1777650 [Lactarius quietus]|nr:hypothetical protein EI94DRAFT_1777650 [Lactarius quietus]
MASTPIEPPNARLFKEWLASHGGHFHSNVRYTSGSEAIESDATIVACPFSIIITPRLSKGALLLLLQDTSLLERWTERQLIIVYICFHWIESTDIYDILIHSPYLDTLPSPNLLRTPLHFSTEELEALKGTNLYGATIDRRRDWEAEWEQCRADVSTVNTEWGKGLTCSRTPPSHTRERYLTASTYLSSRAFPSTLLSTSPSLLQSPNSYPVLIPGVDSLNHARAQPVSWVVSHTPLSDKSQGTISLVTRTAVDGGAEIFNNYGAKPNSELLLGYGFTLPNNPDDTIVLKIGGGAGNDTPRHEVGRGARGADNVWDAIVKALKVQEDEGGVSEWQTVLDGADMLRSMTEALLARLTSGPGSGALRADVADMVGHYVSGQHEVLQDLVEYANRRETDGLAMARREGVVVQLEGDDLSEDAVDVG